MYELQRLTDRLALVHTTNTKIKPISVDFCSPELQYRCKPANLTKETIAKAVGFKCNKNKLSIIDATAGFGYDSFILAALGCKILLIERVNIIFQLLTDGLNRAKHCPTTAEVSNNMQLLKGDAINMLAALPQEQCPDVVYLDPMFPERQKTALAKKEMQALHNLIGEDIDCNKLLAIALKVAKIRVVVKRSRLAPAIAIDIMPSFTLKGKTCRFDIYIRS